MTKKIFLSVCFLFLFLLSSFAFSSDLSRINLLAAVEGESVGNIAYAYLTTETGDGKIFIENNLLSNEDTQLSVRMAKEIVCSNYLNCGGLDFFYTIESGSSLITGPSGGLALTLLTYSHLLGKNVPNNVAMTGTINSGGYIGRVGGLSEKIKGASKSGIKKVLIPFGSRYEIAYNFNSSTLNQTKIDLYELGNQLGVEVLEVATFDDVLKEIYNVEIENISYEVPLFYTSTMRDISSEICDSMNDNFNNLILKNDYYDYESNYCFDNCSNSSLPYLSKETFNSYTNYSLYYNSALELKNSSKISFNSSDFYSTASYCFSSNLKLTYLKFLQNSLNKSLDKVNKKITDAELVLKVDFKTLNEVQVYSVVAERLNDAKDSYASALVLINESRYLEAIDKLSYSYERANTAIAWSKFYDVSGDVKIDSSLESACNLILKEAESRIQYVKFYLNLPLGSEDTLSLAKDMASKKDYALCIYYGLTAKAESDVISSVIGVEEADIQSVLDVKYNIASKIVAKQNLKGYYPILGYSYLEYGKSLRNNNVYSSLLYFQMAQELSNLDLFFDISEKKSNYVIFTNREHFLLGVAVGLFISIILYKLKVFIKLFRKK